MSNMSGSLVGLLGLWLVAFMSPVQASERASSSVAADPNSVKILSLDWTSQIVLSHIAGQLLEQRGYRVSYPKHSSDRQWFLLSSGYADIQMEVWEGSMASQFLDLVERGLIVDAGTHSALTREEWWYPAYVEKACPGLPSWRALKACASIFAENGVGKGVYYTGPWEKPDLAKARALGLNFSVVHLADSVALREQLESALQAQKPIVLFNWTPNWIEAVHKGAFVEFPAYDPACETDPTWGINPKLTWDCGNPSQGWLKKATSRQLRDKHPCAFELIGRLDFSNAQIAAAAAYVEIDGMTAEQAAARWLQEHADSVHAWLNTLSCSESTDATSERSAQTSAQNSGGFVR